MEALDIYRRLPRFLQSAAVALRGLQIQRRRYGGDFPDRLREIRERDGWSPAELRSLRRERLSFLLERAKSSPFWARAFEEWGVRPSAPDPMAEVRKLPVLEKATVQSSRREILSTAYDRSSLRKVKTSGTTGSGLVFWETREAEQERWATWWRYRNWHGFDRSTWCGQFGGRLIVPPEDEEAPFWRVNPAARQVLFSVFHLRPENAGAYADEIRRRRLRWLHGYPSALSTLAAFILDQGLTPTPAVETVTLGAENVTARQRTLMREAFGADVRQHYGLQESVANISECERGTLHVDEDFSLVEFLPVEGRGDDVHKIVGTNWTNPAFPLFRYDTGDRAVIDTESCGCGHPGRTVERIDGRKEDIVVLPDGRRLGRLDHIFKEFVSVREAQIYQPRRERVVLRIVPGTEYDDDVEERLVAAARQRLGDNVDLDVVHCDRIPRTDSGKLRFVVSDVA